MFALTFAATLLASAAALPAALPAPLPAGGPQGPISYPLGTVVQIAVLQPSGNDFMASNYTTGNPATYIETDPSDTTPPLNFVTVNETDSAGYTGVAMQAPGYGLGLTDSGMEVVKDADMKDFYLVDGTLRNSNAPEGFYCK